MHETKDTNVPAIIKWLIIFFGLAGSSLLIGVALHLIFLNWSPYERPSQPVSPLAQLHKIPPEPRLQTNPGLDMAHYREAENAILTSYGWVDIPSGAVRIPIDLAVALVAERGLPSRRAEKE